MAEHLKSVQSELSYTQSRVTSKRKEIQSEAHLKALSDRQLARYVADLKVIKKERGELMEKVSNLQNQIYRANEKMDQFKVRFILECMRVQHVPAVMYERMLALHIAIKSIAM